MLNIVLLLLLSVPIVIVLVDCILTGDCVEPVDVIVFYKLIDNNYNISNVVLPIDLIMQCM